MLSTLLLQGDTFYQRDYYGKTFLHPAAGTAVVVLGLLTWLLPRRYALLPFVTLICFIPCSQRVAIAGLDFNLMRILIIFGWLRILIRGELFSSRFMLLDKLVLAWGVTQFVAYVALFRNGGAVVYMCGKLMEAWGGYFLVRALVQDWDDVFFLARGVVALSIPVAIAFAIEKSTGRNYFSVFGGLKEYTWIREGKLRAAGALGNPILAGCFWASFIPMMGALWWSRGGKGLAVIGVPCALVVVIACASSTPIAAVGAAGFAAFCFRWRHKMREILRGVVVALVVIHFVRPEPVWHLISRIDIVGGSTGYHRYALIDQWIRRFPQWALIGVKSTGGWGWGLKDITNQYVLEAVRGGFACFFVYVWGIVTVFRYTGQLWRSVEHDRAKLTMAWALGACVFTHCASFIAVSYFGQMTFSWYLHIGVIASLAQHMQRQEESDEVHAVEVVQDPGPRVVRRQRRLLGAT